MEYPKCYSDIKTGRSSLEKWLSKNYPDFLNHLKTNYVNIDIKTSLYMFYNNIKTIPLCVCGKPVKFHGYQYGFSKFCCPSCAGKDEEVQKKLKNTKINKYGENYPDIIIKKGKLTKFKRYGDENYNNKEKSKQTCLERYGVDNPMKSAQFLEKSKQTCLEKYGANCFLTSDEFLNKKGYYIEKSKQTRLERYGVDCAMKTSIIKEQVKQTCLERYGADWNCMRPEAKNSRNYNSKPNEDFANLLKQHDIQYEHEFYLNGKSYDFKIGSTLIEINPTATHNINWNPYGGKIISKLYHYEKTQLARENGYNIINVWDWDDVDKILYLINQKQIIYARSCVLKEVDVKNTNIFLNNYHCQNTYKNQKIRIGLYYHGELIAIMTFGTPRYNKKYEWELLRLCFHKDFKIIGGAQKMFTYFIRNYNPKNIISYCDNSKFTGTVYNKLGFTIAANNQPSKHWYNCKTKIHITDNLLRQRGFDQLFGSHYGKNISNEELLKMNGFVELYDAGQFVYKWENKSAKT